MWMCHVTYEDGTRLWAHVSAMSYMCDMTKTSIYFPIPLWMPYSMCDHDSRAGVSLLIHMCAMTHLHVYHESFTCMTWLCSNSWPWLSHTCFVRDICLSSDSLFDVLFIFVHISRRKQKIWTFVTITCSYVCHGSFSCAPWRIYMCDVIRVFPPFCQLCLCRIHMCVHDPLTCVPWLMRMRDMSQSHVWHDSLCLGMSSSVNCVRMCVYLCVCARAFFTCVTLTYVYMCFCVFFICVTMTHSCVSLCICVPVTHLYYFSTALAYPHMKVSQKIGWILTHQSDCSAVQRSAT